MKALDFQPIPYVIEEERGLPTKEQTVFWIKPKSHQAANKTLSRYASCGRDGRKNYRELNPGKLDAADVAEWVTTIVKIENFEFSSSFCAEYGEKVKPNKEGYVKEITDQWMIKEILPMLSADVINEIWDVALDYSRLKEGEKKR